MEKKPRYKVIVSDHARQIRLMFVKCLYKNKNKNKKIKVTSTW